MAGKNNRRRNKRSLKMRDELLVLFSQFKNATLGQLMQILRNEDCDLIFKCAAESELERRAKQNGVPINYGVWYVKAFGRKVG